jgi:hypothetical protein
MALQRGADIIDAKTNDVMTPLHWACEKGHTEVAMALMDTANVNSKKMMAIQHHTVHVVSHTEIVKVIDRADMQFHSSARHCQGGHTEIAKLLMMSGLIANTTDLVQLQ